MNGEKQLIVKEQYHPPTNLFVVFSPCSLRFIRLLFLISCNLCQQVQQGRARQWFFNRFFEIFLLLSIQIKETQMESWWVKVDGILRTFVVTRCIVTKEPPKRTNVDRFDVLSKIVPLPFHSPYNKYTTKINEQFQLEQRRFKSIQMHQKHCVNRSSEAKRAQMRNTPKKNEMSDWKKLMNKKVTKLFASPFVACFVHFVCYVLFVEKSTLCGRVVCVHFIFYSFLSFLWSRIFCALISIFQNCLLLIEEFR